MMKTHLVKLEQSRAIDSNIEIPAPPGLEYLGYQKAGIAYCLQKKDSLIGDQPGLGKTIQVLGFINKTRPKRVLIVAPATLAFNWKLEAQKWLIDPYIIFIPKTNSDPVPDVGDNRLLVITNYEKIVRKFKKVKDKNGRKIEIAAPNPFIESIEKVWDLGVYDEAQALKNPQSKRTQAILGERGFFNRCRRNIFLSGTPIENYPKEIWPIAATIAPVKFGNWTEFAKRYCALHEEERNGYITTVSTGASNLGELQQRLRSTFMVRRLKADVLKELPPKRRQLVVLGDEEIDWSRHPIFQRWKELHEKAYDSALAKLEEAKTREEYNKAVKELDAVVGIAFEEMSEFRHQTALLKLPMCLKYIDELLATGIDSLVIFAHHKDILEKVYDHYKDDAFLLYGETKMEKRGEIVQRFQAGEKRIFIGGLKPAGTGITLTRASTMVFIEIDWNPATLMQCEDRECRIGQKRMVHIIHLALNNSLDVNMSKKVIKKQEVIDKALDHLPAHLRSLQIG